MCMETVNEDLKFECAFSEKAMKNNSQFLTIYVASISIILCYVLWSSGITTLNLWFTFSFIAFMILIAVFSMTYVRRLAKGSYLEITSDGQLKCKFVGRKEECYPINEIKSIEPATIEEAQKKHATRPIGLNSKGDDYYPPTGVLITFNRAWIKSVFPVYFNPADIEGFISAIKKRIKTTDSIVNIEI